jgi:hypothetical protein
MVTQFRVLARFAWLLFWVLNLCGVIMVTYIWFEYKGIAKYLVVFTLFFFLLFDAKNSMENQIHFYSTTQNHFEIGETQATIKRLINQIEISKYQAILPIPYFCVGTEDYSITIDPDDDFITAAMIFSLRSGLPMMASSMGRTPPAFTQNELSLFLNGTYNKELKSAMNNQPILILYNSKYFADSLNLSTWPPLNREPALTALLNGKKIIKEKKMSLLCEEGDWKLFEASIKDL